MDPVVRLGQDGEDREHRDALYLERNQEGFSVQGTRDGI